MPVSQDETWFDDDAGRLVRPYTVSNGRTRPALHLDMLAMVVATGQVRQAQLGLDHAEALSLCRHPVSVVELSAHLRLPVTVTKVLLSDLVDCGAVTATHPDPDADPTNRSLLEALLDGLQRRL